MKETRLHQKPEAELIYKEFEIPFEIVEVPNFEFDEISIQDNKKLLENFIGDKKVMITPKNSFIDIDLNQHFE
jgi:hypothetical protein